MYKGEEISFMQDNFQNFKTSFDNTTVLTFFFLPYAYFGNKCLFSCALGQNRQIREKQNVCPYVDIY